MGNPAVVLQLLKEVSPRIPPPSTQVPSEDESPAAASAALKLNTPPPSRLPWPHLEHISLQGITEFQIVAMLILVEVVNRGGGGVKMFCVWRSVAHAALLSWIEPSGERGWCLFGGF